MLQVWRLPQKVFLFVHFRSDEVKNACILREVRQSTRKVKGHAAEEVSQTTTEEEEVEEYGHHALVGLTMEEVDHSREQAAGQSDDHIGQTEEEAASLEDPSLDKVHNLNS